MTSPSLKALFLIITFALCSCHLARSQSDTLTQRKGFIDLSRENWDWGIKFGAGGRGRGENASWELGVMRFNWAGIPFGMASYGLSNEFVEKGSLFNPKVSAEFSFMFFGSRLSLIDYRYLNKHELRLRPEIGFTILGAITAFYGHDIKLSNTDYHQLPLRRWYFGLNWPFDSHRGSYF